MSQNESPIIVGLDIGTTKIAAIAGRKNEFGKLEILGFGRANSNGVQHGQVLNIDQTIKAIQQALENCHKSNPDLDINEVYVGIAGHHIKSLQTRGDQVRQEPDNEIQAWEIEQLINNQRKTFIPAGDQIIDVIPQEFHVDNNQNIKDPIGVNGVKVGANFLILTGDRNAIRNINRSVESTSDLAVFYDGILKHTAVIPFGGENITNDIRLGLGVLKSQAEAMKVQFGSALADEAKANAYVTIPGLKGMPAKEISVKNLAQIIQARMSEILDFVTYHLKQVGLDSRMLNGGVILTGGGSQLKHLIQLTEYITGLNARIGLPNEHLAPNHIDELKKPMYSTCIGLILKGYNDYEQNYKVFTETFKKVEVPRALTVNTAAGNQMHSEQKPAAQPAPTTLTAEQIEKRKSKFWDRFKNNLIEIFNEEEDKPLA